MAPRLQTGTGIVTLSGKCHAMITVLRSATHLSTRFLRNSGGSIAIMTGLMFPVLTLLAGGVTDMTRAFAIQAKAQRTLDATVLSMARSGMTDEQIATKGPELLKSWLTNRDMGTMLTESAFTSNAQTVRAGVSEKLTGTATLASPVYFLGIFGRQSLDIEISSSSLKPNPLPYEISLVLDVSGSMGWDLNGRPRIDVLKEATVALLDEVEAQSTSREAPAVSVVPYSTSVNLGDIGSSILEGTSARGSAVPTLGGDVWAAERSRGENSTGYVLRDDSPAAAPIPFVTGAEIAHVSPSVRLQGPSQVPATYRATIDGLVANGATAGHLGMIWGVYALSPEWSSVWNTNPKPYGEAEKVIVMLTDGAFNTTQNIGARSTADGDTSNRYFQSACNLAKQKGIRIYTVALSLDPASEGRLKACSNGSGGEMFSADSATTLKKAFEDIARKIGGLRLSS